jgi:hypothetical protein
MRYYLLFIGFILLPAFGKAQGFTTSNLPIVVIDTQGLTISDEPKIVADMGVINNGTVNNLSDAFNDYNGKIRIEYRGSSSQMFPKKPYGFELQDASGNDVSASLLGMPKEEDWTLNATYNDRSLVRDMLAYKLARDMGRYAPRTRLCELVVNGNYQGVYIVIEKIKRDESRVDISKLEPGEIAGDDLTGGYILKIDKTTGSPSEGFYSLKPPLNRKQNQEIYFQIEYPKVDEVAPEQKQYIQKFINDFETTLSGPNFKDPVTGYAKYIDVDSFIDFMIINELGKNVDGYRISSFMYKDKDSKGGKLVMAPIWDFNLAFGNADYCEGGLTTGWMYAFNRICGEHSSLVPFWWDRLLSDPDFKTKLAKRWVALRADKFSTPNIHAYIDSLEIVLNQGAQQRNFAQWPIWNQYVWPNYDWTQQQTYSTAISWMKTWITSRTQWLDENMPKSPADPGTNPVTAIDQLKKESNIVFYPNPSSDVLQFEYEILTPGKLNVILFDMTGKSVGGFEQIHETIGKFTRVHTYSLPPGIYSIKTEFNGVEMSISRWVRL